MTTVGSLSGDVAPGNEAPGKNTMSDLPPSPTNSVPFIIATSADDDKDVKLAVAPTNGGSPMRYLQASSKLDLEPNPFEQSFAGTKSGANSGNSEASGETPKPVLPPIEAMSGRLAPGTDQFGWDVQSLRMGPLSPSMLQGPQNPIAFDQKTTQNPLPIGSFPSSTSSMSTMFSSGAPLAVNGLPFVGAPGPLPVPPPVAIHTSEPYPAYNSVNSTSQQPETHHPVGPQGARQHMNMNDRYMPPQPPQHPDNMNGYGNLHLLSQAQATHREMWIKREGDSNGNASHGQHSQSHPHSQGPPMASQSQSRPHPLQGPPQSGQSLPGMPGMVAAPQLPKNGVEPGFVRGVRRSRMTSDDLSDDSEKSKVSGNGGEGTTGNAKKKQNTGDDKMDEEEKRKNFLERNRQAALKCRQRKKQWLANLQQKVEYLTTDNEHLQSQTAALRDEIIHLKALLLAHKDCPVAQANGVYPETISLSNSHNHGGGMMGPDRSGYSMQGGPGPQGRGGPNQPRGSLPLPPPPPGHHHGGMLGGPRMANLPMASSAAGSGRPISMMQDITPGASPNQGQAHVRY
ncbi:hypothetical protein BC939DRAFT_467243 [Gamsiella multidivaricata]|uniref:uncharacterized protein n=1 Tax=Gamsiella multidivaricata TaxID=101098 RepID=UPI00221EF0F3|nr:uncharacterized protein BC939DRAFT_467243 [Gamsiella multidivaricata]KAG0364542.1 hypothetical protein BGZ54_007397 [Gamsiella multidivaricata]KAI7816986.1 hypothetical protein BC939DRAFT_467243 [Gamsiella multidivaricata]